MVTATSCGARLRLARQRAASHSNAVESGPPDTASTSADALFQSANRCFASAAVSAASSAVDALLLTVDALLHRGGGLRIFARHFAECRARRFLLFEGGERLHQSQQGIRRFRRTLELGGDGKERFRSIAVALALIQTLAEPVLRLRHQPVARIFLQEAAQSLVGQRIVLALDIAIAEVVLVARRIGRRQGCNLRACRRLLRRSTLRWIALLRRLSGSGCARGRVGVGEVERFACAAAARCTDVRRERRRRLADNAAERAWRAGGVGVRRGVERIAATASAGRGLNARLLHRLLLLRRLLALRIGRRGLLRRLLISRLRRIGL